MEEAVELGRGLRISMIARLIRRMLEDEMPRKEVPAASCFTVVC